MIFAPPIDEGVAALQNAGADVVLMNLQYSPRTETMISVPPYLDNMRVVAQQHDVPLFDRFAIMHQWNDAEISTCSARRVAPSLRSASMIASAGRWRNS